MTIETVPITRVVADPANARRHPERNLDAIMGSLMRFGQQKPIVVDAGGIVRAGNGTLAAARALGWTTIDVVRTGLAGVEAAAYAVADNRTAELATWDHDALAGLVADEGLGDVGFGKDEIAELTETSEPTAMDGDGGGGGPASPADNGKPAVVAECDDERDQKALFEQLTREGYPCRLLTL